jgi:acyl dehydratase
MRSDSSCAKRSMRLGVGQVFIFRPTFTRADVALSCGVTGDYNPYRSDGAFAGESWFGRRIVPGLLMGSLPMRIGGLIGFLAAEMPLRVVAPAYRYTLLAPAGQMERNKEPSP